MDLNHVKLSPALVTELYQKSLIEIGESKTEPIQKLPNIQSGMKWLGENKKKVLLIVHYTDAVFLPDEDLDFLTDILEACKLNIADVAILNKHNHTDTSYKDLLNQFNSKTIIMFDVEPSVLELPISFPQFQVQSFTNSSFLFSPSLIQLKKDKVLKSKLWVCLKKIFSL